MNKRGLIIFSVIIGLFIYICGILFLPFLADDIVTFREGLSCSSSTLTYGTMIACLLGDLVVPNFIWLIVSLGIGYILGGRI